MSLDLDLTDEEVLRALMQVSASGLPVRIERYPDRFGDPQIIVVVEPHRIVVCSCIGVVTDEKNWAV